LGQFKFWIISGLVEKEPRHLYQKDLLPWGSVNRRNFLWPNGSIPGPKSIRLAKKGGGSSFPKAGFRRFSPVIPLPPLLFAETKRGETGGFLPALFGFGACFLPGQRGDGDEQLTKSEMTRNFEKFMAAARFGCRARGPGGIPAACGSFPEAADGYNGTGHKAGEGSS
jgi:hypothetical protein